MCWPNARDIRDGHCTRWQHCYRLQLKNMHTICATPATANTDWSKPISNDRKLRLVCTHRQWIWQWSYHRQPNAAFIFAMVRRMHIHWRKWIFIESSDVLINATLFTSLTHHHQQQQHYTTDSSELFIMFCWYTQTKLFPSHTWHPRTHTHTHSSCSCTQKAFISMTLLLHSQRGTSIHIRKCNGDATD